jgi:threonine dehydrogenase-like Zn-dependent dehydrogenase
LADYFCLPIRNLHPVPDTISNHQAVFAEPLAAACEVLEQIHVHPTDRVVVLGDGKLGLLIAQVLALTGCELKAVGRHREKLCLLAARGIQTQVGVEGLASYADLVVECTGRPEGFETARRVVRPRGTLVLKSTYHGLVQADLSRIVVDEVQLVGSRCGPLSSSLRLLAQDLVDVTSMIEAEYSLDEAMTAIEHAGRRGALKVLVRP